MVIFPGKLARQPGSQGCSELNFQIHLCLKLFFRGFLSKWVKGKAMAIDIWTQNLEGGSIEEAEGEVGGLVRATVSPCRSRHRLLQQCRR